MAKITDPDSLAQTTDIVFDTSAKTIEVKSTGAISGTGSSATNGVTMQCLYSFAKEEWRTDTTLIKFPFPFDPITAEQFELVNGWDFLNDTSRNLVRDAGWAVRDSGTGNISDMWANITTLGAFDAGTDQAYIQQSTAGSAINLDFAGEVNQAVQIYVDTNADGTPDTDERGYFKIFLREEGKTFDSYDLITEQSPTNELGETKMTYRKYAMPLSNANDLNYVETDANIGTIAPYTDIDIEYLTGNGFTAVADTTYSVDDVVQEDNGAGSRWFICTGAGTVTGSTGVAQSSWGGTATWSSYTGERQIGTNWYAFNVIVDGNVDDTDANASKGDIYEKVQYSLRQATDIDSGAGSVIGKTADDLMYFVGSELTTQNGVFVDDYLSTEVNDYTFYDVGGTARTFPFVAGITINFDANAQADTSGFRYVLFFTNDDAGDNLGNDYGTSGAIIIDNNAGTDIEGTATATAQVTTDFDYDNNVQRGAGSAGTDAPYTAVGLGTDEAQFATVTGTITATATNTINFVTAKERVYLNP